MKQQVIEEHMFILPLEEKDYKSYCYIGIENEHKLSRLSDSMKQFLWEVLQLIMGETVKYKRKEFALLLKNA